MANPLGFIKRALKLERSASFTRLWDEIRKQPLSLADRQRFLARIMTATASGEITPQEAKKLTKAIMEGGNR